jgi:hypothetical protein
LPQLIAKQLQSKGFYFFSNAGTVNEQAIGLIDGYILFVLVNDF